MTITAPPVAATLETAAPVLAGITITPGGPPCFHPPFCSCPTPDPAPRLDALAADWDAEIAKAQQGEQR